MQFDSTVNVAEEMNGVALCDEAADVVLKNCPTAEAQKALLKVLKNFDAPKDQVREALLWTKNGDMLKTSPTVPAYSHLDAKYVEWKKTDLKNQTDRVAAHNAKVVADYMKDDDIHGVLTLQRALSAHANAPNNNTTNGISPAVVAHFLDSHPAVVRKDGVFLVEVRDFQQKSWYLMPASEKMSFFKRVKIFFKLIFGAR